MSPVTKERTRYLVLVAIDLSKKLSVLIMAMSIMSLAGYFYDIGFLYRPAEDQVATHPYTAIQAFFIALCIVLNRPGRRQHIKWILVVSLLLSLSWLADEILGSKILYTIIPFTDIALSEHNAGKINHVGINTFITFLLIWFSVTMKALNYNLGSQSAAFAALSFPSLSLFGYAYSITPFHGEMSLLSTATLLLLSSAALWSTANHGVVRAVLSPYIGGQIARFQFATGCIFAFFLGYLVVKSIASIQYSGVVGAYAVAVCWLIIILVTISAALFERSDKIRRRMENQLANSARTDPLTGLMNRRAFNEVLKYEAGRTNRYGTKAVLILMDIDHFKGVNDTYGHPVGDEVLKRIAATIRDNIRDTDSACRFGGEEFAILLSDTSPEGGLTVSHALRKVIEETDIVPLPEQSIKVTASFGLTQLAENRIEDALIRADKALYQSKERGRNRVSVHVLATPRHNVYCRRSNQVVRQLAF